MTKKNKPQDEDMRSPQAEERDHIDALLDDEEEEEVEQEQLEEEDELTILENKLKQAQDKLLRQAADNENYLKRVMRETDDKIKYANQSLITKFLPVLDNFDLTLQHAENSTVETIAEGVMLTQKVMLDTLTKSGLCIIAVKAGDMFDPKLHEAIGLASNPELPNNSIAMVLQNGYTLEGRIIRPAKVQVNKLA